MEDHQLKNPSLGEITAFLPELYEDAVLVIDRLLKNFKDQPAENGFNERPGNNVDVICRLQIDRAISIQNHLQEWAPRADSFYEIANSAFNRADGVMDARWLVNASCNHFDFEWEISCLYTVIDRSMTAIRAQPKNFWESGLNGYHDWLAVLNESRPCVEFCLIYQYHQSLLFGHYRDDLRALQKQRGDESDQFRRAVPSPVGSHH